MRMLTIVLLSGGIVAGQIGFTNHRVNKDATAEVQNEQQIMVNPTDSANFVAVWRDFRVGYLQVGHAATFDRGQTWVVETLFVEPTYNWDSDPGLTVDANGNFFAIILSFNSTSEPDGYFIFESTDKGRTWSAPRTVINQVPGVFEDKELIACDRTSSPYQGNLYVTWARFYAIDIMNTRSTNRGFNWSTPVPVSDASSSYQWPVPAVGPSGDLYIAWCASNAIRFDRSTDGGLTFGTDRTIQSIYSMSRNLKGGLIATYSYPAMDVDITGGSYNGNIYIAFMDNGTDGFPDMYVTKSTDRGQTWSARRRINDDPLNNRIDQFHPWLTVDRTGCISVIFYDSRLDPNNMLCDVYMVQSTDGGNTWSNNIRVTTVSSDLRLKGNVLEPPDPTKPLAGMFAGHIGEYNGVAASSRFNVVPIWTDTRNGNQDTYVGVFHYSGIEAVAGAGGSVRFSCKPNPVRDRLEIELMVEQPGHYEICLYDGLGRRMKELFGGALLPGRHRLTSVGLSEMRPGVYFIEVESSSGTEHRKVVVQR